MLTANRTEDAIFAEWRTAENEQKAELERELYSRLKQHAFAVVWLILQESRPDIVEEAIYEVLRKPEAFKGEAKFTTWFEAIVRNICKRKLRYKIKHKNDVSLDNIELPVGRVEEEVHSRLQLEDICSRLSTEERELLRLKQEEATEEEISRRFHISCKGVRSRWFRLRAKILKELK